MTVLLRGSNSFVLAEGIDDMNPDDETGYQRFLVDLPANVTCDSCTIQVKQWVYDLSWYYYACVDVEIVDNSDNNDDGSFVIS